jgi:hypothetical protein
MAYPADRDKGWEASENETSPFNDPDVESTTSADRQNDPLPLAEEEPQAQPPASAWEQVDYLRELGLDDEYLLQLAAIAVGRVEDLPRLVALAFEEPIGTTNDTGRTPSHQLLAAFGRQLYRAFVVQAPVEPTASMRVDGPNVEYTFSIDCPSLRINAVVKFLADDAPRLLSQTGWRGVSLTAVAERHLMDPLDDLEHVFRDMTNPAHQRFHLPHNVIPVLEMRFGLTDGRKRTLEEIALRYEVTRERIRQIESVGLRFLGRPAVRGELGRLVRLVEHLSRELEVEPEDSLLAMVMKETFPGTRHLAGPWLRLLSAITGELWAELKRGAAFVDRGLIDRTVANVLARDGEMAPETLVAEVARRLEVSPTTGLRARIKASKFYSLVGGIVRLESTVDLDHSSRRVRRLNFMKQVLQRDGPLHFSELAVRIRSLLGSRDTMGERNVHAWLDRYKDLFVWVGPGTYRVRLDTDAALEREGLPDRYAPSRRRGIGDAIVALLLERQPRSLSEIESHVLPRFMVNRGSVLASILQDRARRFVMTDDRLIFLSDADIAAFEAEKPKMNGLIDWNELATDLADLTEEAGSAGVH